MAEKRKLRKTSAWQRLKKRWNRKGVVEIDEDHPNYDELCCIRQGIREVLINNPHLGPKDVLESVDYEHVLEKTVTINGKKYTFCSYASPVFASIRRAIDVDEEQYQKSLAPPEALPYLEFHSNSRSGQHFFLSTDMQYFLKTDYKKPVMFFLSILRDYLAHFQSNPHSLLVKYLGLYSVKTSGKSEKFYMVMQSVFFPSERIEEKFDIKGCYAGRYQKPSSVGALHIPVLKDQNFWTDSIDLGSQRDWFLRTIDTDARFLSDLGVIDYSLLIGRQHLRDDERRESISNLVCRVQKSLYDPTTGQTEAFDNVTTMLNVGEKSFSSRENTQSSLPGSVVDSAVSQLSKSDQSPEHVKKKAFMNSVEPKPAADRISSSASQTTAEEKGADPSTGGSVGNGIETRLPQSTLVSLTHTDSLQTGANRRLLPNCKNSLHIIDGRNCRYFVGIIDFLTEYNFHQKVNAILKDMKYACGDHSTVAPGPYSDRFRRFIRERTV